jgi:hypothetical protein
MLHDLRGDYIRREEPQITPPASGEAAVWVVAFLLAIVLMIVTLKFGIPTELDATF